MATSLHTMVVDTTNSTSTGTMQSRKSPRKHHSVPTLQDMMSADETLTGLPTRVPECRLRGRKGRDVLAAIEKNGNPQRLDQEHPTRRRRKSDFEIYRDGRVEKRGESSLETTTAIANTLPASLKKNKSPGSHSYRERRREKEIEALEEEYVNDRRAKAASPIGEDTESESTATAPRSDTRNKPSISHLLLSHGNPDPQFTPLPAPPLSLLHRKFTSLTTPSPAPQKAQTVQKTLNISPTPILPPPLPDQDISPLQHMRAFRAHFEALLPAPQPKPQHRSRPQPSPRQQPPSQQPPLPRQDPPKTQSSASPASFVHQYAFTLSHLTPLTHHSKTAIVSLTPTNAHSSGFITLQLRNLAELKGGGKYTYIIPTHGLPVTVTDHESGSRHTYEIEDLPLKHLQAVRYAKHFVDVVKKGTIVGRVEVREKFGGGAVWLGRRWGDGRFEALKEGAEGGVVVEIQGERGDKVRILKSGKPVRETPARYEKVIDRAQRMWSACNRVLEEAEQTEDEDDGDVISEDSDETTTVRKRAEMVSPSRNSSSRDSAASESNVPDLDRTFRIDATTTFVPNVGWCRRAGDNGWWSMLFLDGVRLEIDPTSGDAVWIERGGARRVLKRGMEMKKVRERVKMFVDQGL